MGDHGRFIIVTEQEKLEELSILDKACRQCGNEFAANGVRVLRIHAEAVNAMVRKLDRLEAAPALSAPVEPVPAPVNNDDLTKGISQGNGSYRPDPDCPHPGVPA